MKTSVKIWLIVAAALVMAGIILSIVGVAVAGSSIGEIFSDRANPGRLTEHTLVLEDGELADIALNLVSYRITFVITQEKKASIVYTKYEKDLMHTVNTNGRLELSEESGWERGFLSGLSRMIQNTGRSHKTCEIRIPEGSAPDIMVENVNGTIEFHHISAGRLSVESVNAKLSGERLNISEKLQLNTVNGEIRLDKASAGSIRASTVNGSIELSGICAGDIEGQTINGSVKCSVEGSKDDYAVIFDTVNGSLTVNGYKARGSASINRGADRRVSISTVNGSGRVDFVKPEETAAPSSVHLRLLAEMSGKEEIWREKTVGAEHAARILEALGDIEYREGKADGRVDFIVEYISDKTYRYEFSASGVVINGVEYRTDTGAADSLRSLYDTLS